MRVSDFNDPSLLHIHYYQVEAKVALEIYSSAQECLGLVGYLEGLSLTRASESYNYNRGEIAAVVSSHIEWLLPHCLSNVPVRSKWDPLCSHQCLLEALCTEYEAIESTHIAGIFCPPVNCCYFQICNVLIYIYIDIYIKML